MRSMNFEGFDTSDSLYLFPGDIGYSISKKEVAATVVAAALIAAAGKHGGDDTPKAPEPTPSPTVLRADTQK
ncbi:MAG TPA: hypothetical protein VFT59_05680 [Candidatus Saccharimonadales bacterium]|nr:hypothetical protein [Candidatus Saccharimonadales bacterium]